MDRDESALLDSEMAQINSLVDEFEQSLRAGGSPRIEDFLVRFTAGVRPLALRELLRVEIELRLARRESVSVGEYLQRFRGLETPIYDAFRQSDVALATAAHNPSDPATRDHHESDTGSGHLEVRCPNCHAPTEVAVDTSLTDLTCSSCGSHFSLVDQSQATRMAPSLTKMGRFELIERIGVGAFGSVWKARDKELDRTVAIKIPRAGGMTAEEQEKFFREARAAAQLNHPNIVSVHEVGRDRDSVYIVSDFVRGVTLGDWLTGQQLTSREAVELCAKLADALHHAHEQGVVHRDLKPANIMMDYEGQPHLMDFGLARREAGEVTMTIDGQVLGTPAYMSPEQAEGEAHTADRRSDVYSLGVILFQLLTGELPFRGNARMLIKQVVHDEPPSPRKLNANISKDLETITLKCLEKDPQRRYQTARELGDELNRFLAGEPILARPIDRAQRAWRWCRRRPSIAGLAAAVAALLLFVAIAGPLIALRQSILRVKAEEDEARATRLAADEAAARKDAEQARQLEREQRKKVEELVEANRQQLVRMNVLQGDALVDRNDPARALPWYFDALRLDQGDAKREAPHRLRLATLWQNLPKFCHVWRHDAAVVGVTISRDERFIATASEDHTARVWNLATGEPTTPPLAHDATVLSTAFSPDAMKLITAGGVLGVNGEIRVWDVATGKPLDEPIRSPTTTYVYAAFTDAGDILSVEVPMSGHGLVRLRKPDTHEIVATKTCQPYSPGYEAVTQLADVPRGRILERDGNSLRVVDLTGGGRTLCELPHSANPIRSPRFSNDGTRLFTAEWNKLHVWDVETGRELANFEGLPSGWDGEYLLTLSARFTLDNSRVTIAGNGGQVMQFVVDSGKIAGLESVPDVRHARPIISGDGRFVAHIMRDGAVRIWDVRSEQVVASPLNHSSSVTDALFATNGQQIVTACGDGSVRTWDLATASGVVWQISDNNLARVDLSADGKEIITFGPMSVRRWRIDTHKLIAEFVVPGSSPNVAMAPHGMPLYAVGRNDGTAQVWNYVTGKPVSPELKHEKKELNFVRISSDGTRLATIDVDSRVGPNRYLGLANVWDIESGRRIFGPFRFSGIISGTIGMAFSPDSRLVAVAGATVTLSGVQPQLTVIDLGTSQAMKQQFTHSPGNGVFEVTFDPRGRYLVSRTQNTVAIGSGEMRVWDLKEGREVGVARRFGDDPTSLEIDPESRFVAASVANQVYIYHLETGEPAGAPLMHDAFVSRVAFSPGGEYLISSSLDNMIRVWDVATGRRMGPTFPHPAPVYEFEITADGGLLTACGDGWARYWGFRPFDRPQNDILRMARLLSAEEISDSQIARASAADELREDWDALRHRYPADFRSSEMQRQVWHERQATNYSNQQDWLGSIGHFEQLAKLKNVNHVDFGVVLCEAGQFERGADQFDQAIERQPDVFRNWYVAAAARLRAGNIARYRETCRKMLERFAKTDDPQAASDTAKICLLGPNEFQTDSLPFELAERAMLHEAGHPLSGWIRLSKAIADYRAGNFDQARAHLEKLNDEPVVAERTTTVKFLLAMVQWRQEKRDEARASLANAVDYAANNPIEGYAGSWLGRTLVGVAQREAEELIAGNQLPTSTHRPVPTRR